MRLIDADALQAVTECCVDEAGFFAKFNVVHEEEIQKAPTIDTDTLRPHGRWEEMHYEGGILDGTNFDRCSVCGYERVFDDPAFKTGFRYCPNCGADMRGNLNA